MDYIAINTSQNVNINFRLASVGERMLAYIIDLLIIAAYLFCIYLIFFELYDISPLLESMDGWSAAAIVLIITFPIYIYTLISESMMEGQTFGKKIVKIRVVKIDGYQASFGDYLIRWVFRLVDIYSNFAIVGLLTTIFTKNNQRFGGIASGTAVISLKNEVNISHTILENLNSDYQPSFPQVVALSDNDMRIIKDNYTRAVASGDSKILRQLASKIKEIIKLENNSIDLTDKTFISTIIKDYNFYTGKEN